MKASKKMQEVVTELADSHGVDLAAPNAYLELRLSGLMPLCIKRRSRSEIAVYHYHRSGGRRHMDPRVIFFTIWDQWLPIAYRQDNLGIEHVYARVQEDEGHLEVYGLPMQADLAVFSDTWADNIVAQSWLQQGEKWEPCDPKNVERPDLETLMQWESEGGCEAVDGCWVEPDGAPCHGVVNRSQSDH